MIHVVKGISVVNEVEVDVFWNSLAFSVIQQMLVIWSQVPLPLQNPACTSGISGFMWSWSLAWRVLSITLLECETSTIVQQLEHSLTLPLFWIGMKTDLFQSHGHCWVFQICWYSEVSTLTVTSSRTVKNSAGIPSPPLAFLLAMLPKAHLPSHSRMLSSRWTSYFIFCRWPLLNLGYSLH